jgi:hypothetical protein
MKNNSGFGQKMRNAYNFLKILRNSCTRIAVVRFSETKWYLDTLYIFIKRRWWTKLYPGIIIVVTREK